MVDNPSNLPERRKDDLLVGYRLDQMEKEQEKTNLVLNSLDLKLDTLRADLFERSIFVNINTMELALQQRDYKILDLQRKIKEIDEQDEKDTNLRWVKVGIGASLFVGVLSCAIAVLSILVRK